MKALRGSYEETLSRWNEAVQGSSGSPPLPSACLRRRPGATSDGRTTRPCWGNCCGKGRKTVDPNRTQKLEFLVLGSPRWTPESSRPSEEGPRWLCRRGPPGGIRGARGGLDGPDRRGSGGADGSDPGPPGEADGAEGPLGGAPSGGGAAGGRPVGGGPDPADAVRAVLRAGGAAGDPAPPGPAGPGGVERPLRAPEGADPEGPAPPSAEEAFSKPIDWKVQLRGGAPHRGS
jgi:hypothetical protein